MGKLILEVDREGNVRGIESHGIIGKSIGRRFYGKANEIPNLEKATATLTDHFVTSKIYELPKLKTQLLEKALREKISKDLEFVFPSEEIEWVKSEIRTYEGKTRYLVSATGRNSIESFPKFEALTLTPQAINLFLSGKTNKTFMLIHSFNKSAIIFTFYNGFLDYIRSVEISDSFEENINLTIQYYKEQKKTQISEIYCSGDLVKENPFKNYSLQPISSMLNFKVKGLSEKETSEFLAPISVNYLRGKLEYLYSVPGNTPKLVMSMLSLCFLGTSVFLLNSISSLKESENSLILKREKLKNQATSIDIQIQKLQQEISKLQTFRKSALYTYLLNAKRLLLPEFIESLNKSNEKLKFYLINLEFKNGVFTATMLCPGTKETSQKNLSGLLGILASNPHVEKTRLINTQTERLGIIATFEIKLKGSKYVKE